MTTRLLDTPAAAPQPDGGRTWGDAPDWICDVLTREGLTRARHVVGLDEVARLELRVDDALVAAVAVRDDLGQACGVSVAAALLERQARGDCETWVLRLAVHDDEVGADLLIREWRCPD